MRVCARTHVYVVSASPCKLTFIEGRAPCLVANARARARARLSLRDRALISSGINETLEEFRAPFVAYMRISRALRRRHFCRNPRVSSYTQIARQLPKLHDRRRRSPPSNV